VGENFLEPKKRIVSGVEKLEIMRFLQELRFWPSLFIIFKDIWKMYFRKTIMEFL